MERFSLISTAFDFRSLYRQEPFRSPALSMKVLNLYPLL